jgi:hypothetical protein
VPVPGQWSLSHNLTDVLEAYDCKSLGLHPNCSVCKVHPELASWIFTLDKMPVQGSITSLYMFWPVEMLLLCQWPTKKKTVPNSAPPNWLHDLCDLWILAEFWDWTTTLITELENLNKDMNQTKPSKGWNCQHIGWKLTCPYGVLSPTKECWMKFSDVWLVVHAQNLGTHENIWKMYQISRTKAMFVSVNFFLGKSLKNRMNKQNAWRYKGNHWPWPRS